MNTLAYVTIQYPDHTYKATVTSFDQLEDYLSSNLTPFKIIDWDLKEPNPSKMLAMAETLNRISRYSHSLNKPATAVKARDEYPTNNDKYEIRECGEFLTELAVYIKHTNMVEAVFAGCDRYSLAYSYCQEH